MPTRSPTGRLERTFDMPSSLLGRHLARRRRRRPPVRSEQAGHRLAPPVRAAPPTPPLVASSGRPGPSTDPAGGHFTRRRTDEEPQGDRRGIRRGHRHRPHGRGRRTGGSGVRTRIHVPRARAAGQEHREGRSARRGSRRHGRRLLRPDRRARRDVDEHRVRRQGRRLGRRVRRHDRRPGHDAHRRRGRRDRRLRRGRGHGRPDGRAHVGRSSGTCSRSTSPRRTPSRPATRRSSWACSTRASRRPTPTSRRRSRSTRAPRASAASSTRAVAAWSPTTSDHGTHVAGTIAAAINGVGIAGVAPGVKVASVKVVNDDGFIFPEAAICAYLWAADHGMPITNNSYFIDPWEFNCVNDPRQRPVWQAVQRALALLVGAGHPDGGLGGQQQRRPAAQVHRLERARTTAATPSRTAPSPGVPRPAGRGARRRDGLGRRPDRAEELLLVVRPGRRRRDGSRRRHRASAPAAPRRPSPTASSRPRGARRRATAAATSRAPRWRDRTRPASRRSRCRRTRA